MLQWSMTLESHELLILADATLVAHGSFIVFVVGGQTLILMGWACGWCWVRGALFRIAHLLAIGVVVLQAWLRVPCPLTVLEQHLRTLAGDSVYDGSFVAYWLHRLIFFDAPHWVFTTVYTLFGALVVLSFMGCPPKFGSAKDRDGPPNRPSGGRGEGDGTQS